MNEKLNLNECPVCHSRDIDCYDTEGQINNQVTETYCCYQCDIQWRVTYDFAYIEMFDE